MCREGRYFFWKSRLFIGFLGYLVFEGGFVFFWEFGVIVFGYLLVFGGVFFCSRAIV